MGSNNSTITGYVFPVDWDRHGTVIEVAIFTDFFEKYIVANTTKSMELLKHIDVQVCANAIVTGEDLIGNRIIEVKDFKLLKETNGKTKGQTTLDESRDNEVGPDDSRSERYARPILLPDSSKFMNNVVK